MNASLPGIPVSASEVGDLFEPLFWYIVAVTAGGTLLVGALLTVFCVQYRRQNTTGSTPRILGSHRLELFWTITPLMIFLTFYAWGVYIYDRAVQVPNDIPEIFVIGKQWMWKAQYPNGQRVIIGGNPANMSEEDQKHIGALVLPLGKPVKVTFISEDVIHDFGVPAFRQKIDVIPGRYVSTWYHPTKLGEFHVFCDQYCGTWHSLMVGKIHVVPPAEFEQFLEGKGGAHGSENPVDGSPAFKGWQHFQRLQCQKCHVPNAGAGTREHPQAPTLEGLFGRTVPLKGGTSVVADDQYLRESVVNPRAKVVEGWEPIMPGNYRDQVTEEELRDLVAYIKWLKPGQMIPPNDKAPSLNGAPRETKPESGSAGGGK
ncbi:MAG: cytochrome c oxidase subunit II [Gemmataceae bacterium]|nr:cytochrome c oxidase subunit II [Gemmataceae bacterium]